MEFEDFVEESLINLNHEDQIDFLLGISFELKSYFTKKVSASECVASAKQTNNLAKPICPCDRLPLIIEAESAEVCPECGIVRQVLSEDNNGVYMADREKPKIGYERINHFNEFLARFTGMEKTPIPVAVLDKLVELHDGKKATMESVRAHLRRLRLPKYYENWVQISSMMKGDTPPVLHQHLADRLRTMFQASQGPFYHIKNRKRKNFFSYSYFTHKALEILGQTEYLPYLPLLKCRKKLIEQDEMWKSLCSALHWRFIPSSGK